MCVHHCELEDGVLALGQWVSEHVTYLPGKEI